MASLIIHLLIAQEYCKKHEIEDEEAFLQGNLAPDMVPVKWPTHYSRTRTNKTHLDSILNKVDLPAFCADNDISSDFNKGKFLHLISDVVFFNNYLAHNENYLAFDNANQLLIQNVLYRDYHRVNDWLMKTHKDLRLDLIPEDMLTRRTDDMEIISKEAVAKIVDYCSDINLERAYKKYSSMSPSGPVSQ